MTQPEARDVPNLICDWLAADLAGRFPELSVALELPANWAPHVSGPVLLVEDDGDPMGLPHRLGTTPTTRITSWTTGRDRRYIHAAMARLLTTPITGIAKVLPGTGVLDARDPTTGGDLASITVRARARLAVPQ
jgi:hypothetical protein